MLWCLNKGMMHVVQGF